MPQVGPIRLTKEDHDRLLAYVRKDGRSQADVIREAIIQYLDGSDTLENDERLKERDLLICNSLKSIETRFATLIVRMGIDLEAIYALAWALTEQQPDRQKLFDECYQVGVERFRRSIRPHERKMIDALQYQEDRLKPAEIGPGKEISRSKKDKTQDS